MGAQTYPADDLDFKEVTIAKVGEKTPTGASIERSDGWSFWVPADSPVAPVEGMTARFYGKGIGYTVRGLFLDGVKVFYRTVEEDRQHHENERYGKDAADLVRKWDRGDIIQSITMGGFGPGYEQALQIAAIECAREGLDVPLEGPQEGHQAIWDEVCDHALERIKGWCGGLSGAQFGAAKWLAWQWVHGGGPAALVKKYPDDRHTMVSKGYAHSGPLTAAAPDLLAVLQGLVASHSAGADFPEINAARAAIAAAVGEQA